MKKVKSILNTVERIAKLCESLATDLHFGGIKRKGDAVKICVNMTIVYRDIK